MLGLSPARAQPGNLVSYAGNTGQEKLLDIVRLSDGACLAAGTAQDLNWVPAAVPRTVLAGTAGIHNAGRATPRIGFILQLSADLGRVLRVVSLPAGAAESITHLETINVPGQPTGTLFISGTVADSRAQGGYFLARLDQNFVTGAPTGLLWVYNVWGEVYVADSQPWDVGSDGRLVFVTGQSHGADWCAAHALNGTTGQLVPIANWRTHWLASGSEFQGVAAAAPGGLAAVSYRAGPAATYGVTSVAIDRRRNDCYLGFNVQTVLPGGQPDFEPAVLALPWLRPAAGAGGAASTTKSRPRARP